MPRSVLVVGAGVAGLACARALRRADIDVTVVERRGDEPASGPRLGLGLNLPGNAVRALHRLGVSDEVLDKGIPVMRREYRTAGDRLLFAVDEGAFWSEVATSVCVRPGHLLRALGDGLDVQRDVDIVRVDARPGRPCATRGNGVEETYDLIVGADGVHSSVRNAITTLAPRASVMTQESWRFVVPDPGVECWTAWTGNGLTLLLIPVATGEIYGYASSTRGSGTGDDPAWLAESFDLFPAPGRAAVAAASHGRGTLLHAPVEEVRIDTWHGRGVVLVGDAAHATGPVWAQGAATALEDALVLAEELHGRADWSDAVAAWEQRRRPRVAHVQAATDRMSRLAGLPTWLTHVVAPFAGPRAYRAAYEPLLTAP